QATRQGRENEFHFLRYVWAVTKTRGSATIRAILSCIIASRLTGNHLGNCPRWYITSSGTRNLSPPSFASLAISPSPQRCCPAGETKRGDRVSAIPSGPAT